MSASDPQQLSFRCPSCNKNLRAHSRLAGKKLTCPKCQAPLTIPTPAGNIPFDEETEGEGIAGTSSAGDLTLQRISDSTQPDSLPPNPAFQQSGASPLSGASLFDDDLPELAPLVQSAIQDQMRQFDQEPSKAAVGLPTGSKASSPSKQASQVQKAVPEEEDEFRLAPPETRPPRGEGTRFGELPPLHPSAGGPLSLDDLHLEGKALDVGGGKSREQEIIVTCKICGSRMVVGTSKIGLKVQCTDCLSSFSVSPPPAPKPKPKTIQRDELADVSFEPITAQSSKAPVTTKSQTEELLRKAKEANEIEQKELEGITVEFDTQKWLARTFWFLKDPQLIYILALLGALSAIWLSFASAAPELLSLPNERVAAVVQGILFILPGMFIMLAILSIGMCVVTMVANQYKLIQDWPFGRPGEVFGEVVVLLAAAAIAAAPGGMLGIALATATQSSLVMPLLSIASFWLLFPFVFLSISENGSLTEPYSQTVFESIGSKKDHWGSMYFQTLLAAVLLFVLIGWAVKPGQIGEVLLGLFGPFLILFLFNQYGLLAGRISEVTGLQYSGDFSDDDQDGTSL